MREGLKPCPFCIWQVQCGRCGASGRNGGEDIARAAWNARPDSKPEYKYATFEDMRKQKPCWSIATYGERLAFNAARERKE